MKTLFIFTFLILFIQGCSYTVYHPVPPTSINGQQCVKVCETKEYKCKIKEIEYIKQCENKNIRRQRAFEYCMEHNQKITEQINHYCSNSPNKSQCMKDQTHVYKQLKQFKMCQAPDQSNNCNNIDLNCEDRYERCFLNCGGTYYAEQREIF